MKKIIISLLMIGIPLSLYLPITLSFVSEESDPFSSPEENPLVREVSPPSSTITENDQVSETSSVPEFTVDDFFTIQALKEKYGDSLASLIPIDPQYIEYDDLRYLEILHVGFDGEIHQGELIVNQAIAEEVLQIFKELYTISFPIEKMKAIHHYDNSDELSMEDNNTSAFNFRMITNGSTPSNHAYGLAIDINPKINPYVYANKVLPANGEDYTDRGQEIPGMITAESEVCEIFKKYGWSWGGDWNQPKDYQHFEKNIS